MNVNPENINADSVAADRTAILARMAAEIEAIVATAPRVWQDCLARDPVIRDRPGAVVLTGCGDSYYAGLAARQLLEDLTGCPTVAWPAMEVATNPSVLLSSDALLVGVSVSGKVGRTIEAVEAHRARGGRTVAVTAFADSNLAVAADAVVATGVRGTRGSVPGTANYVASLLGLIGVGVSLAEESRGEAAKTAVAETLRLLPGLLPAAREFAETVSTGLAEPFFILGSGSDAGTAHYAVAKFLEAAGAVGIAQDLEEWAHEQYFATDEGTTVLVTANDERSLQRAAEVAEMASAVGARVVGVGLPGLERWATATMELPAVGAALAPLLSWLPFAVTALTFSRRYDRYPFGIDRADRIAIVDRSIYVPAPSQL